LPKDVILRVTQNCETTSLQQNQSFKPYLFFTVSLFLKLKMPNIMVTWLPKACRNEKVRKEVAAAIIKAVSTGDVAANAEISKENVVVRFGEAVDGFPLPKGHDHTNVDMK